MKTKLTPYLGKCSLAFAVCCLSLSGYAAGYNSPGAELNTGLRIENNSSRASYKAFLSDLSANAQQGVTVTGRVTDETGAGVPGVTVLAKGTSAAAPTDMNGKYSLTIPNGVTTLVFSFVGYITQEVPVGRQSTINVSLKSDARALDEVVVVGYGTQKKSDLTGAVAVVAAEDMQKQATPNVAQALQGMAPGVRVKGTSEPGANPTINVRGISTLNNNSPLIVLDGMFVDNISNIAADDIESMQVLKDASASAIYGSRAANGVIIITSKKGKRDGKLTVNLDSYYGVQNIYQRWDVMGREDYQRLTRQSAINDGLPVDPGNDPNSPLFVKDIDTDWQKEAWKPGPMTQHFVSVSGGSEVNRFMVSGGYNKVENTIVGRGPNYERYNVRLTADHTYKKFKFGESLLLSKTSNGQLTSYHSFGPVMNVVRGIPTVGVYDPKNVGGYAGSEGGIHGVQYMNIIGWNNMYRQKQDENYVLAGLNTEYEIMDGLSVSARGSYSTRMWNRSNFTPLFRMGSYYSNVVAKANEYRGEQSQALFNMLANYKKSFSDKHHIDAMVGYEAFRYDWAQLGAYAEGFTEPYLVVIDNGPSNRNSSGSSTAYTYESFFSRLNYNFADRYLLTATIRRDANSRFARNNRVGYFPSLAAAWNVHNESFFTVPMVSSLKVRTSYGELGNAEVPGGNYPYQTVLNTNAGYIFGSNYTNGVTQTSVINPNIRWETTQSLNAGFDMGLWDEKFTMSFEYYRNTTRDILFPVDIPYSVGSISNPVVNLASIRNSGIESAVSYSNSAGKLNYSISGNISTVNNEVLKLGDRNEPVYGANSKTEVGRSIGEIYGWKVAGLFQSEEEIKASAAQPNAMPGDIKFVDLNKDGIIDGNDRTYLGKAIPDFSYGFNLNAEYKGFDFFAQLYGVQGNSLYNSPLASFTTPGNRDNALKSVNNYWTPENRDTDIPRPTIRGFNNNRRASDRYVESGSYLRLSNMQLGYNVTSTLLKDNPYIRNLRVYASVQNLLTLTKYSGLDPEISNQGGMFSPGFDYGSYPAARTYLMGIKLTL